MFRVLLASGLFTLLGIAAPAQAQVYQPGLQMAYYHPVPSPYGYSARAVTHYGYAHHHSRPRRQAYWHDSCRCASPRAVYGRQHVIHRRHYPHVQTGYVNAPVYAVPRRKVYRDSYVYQDQRVYRRPAPVYRSGYAAEPRYSYSAGPVYRQRQVVRSYSEADRPYGYAYRPRPNYRNDYSRAYREDAGSWRTRRDGVVVIHPRQTHTRPAYRADERYLRPGNQGAVIVNRPHGQYQQPRSDMRHYPRSEMRHQPYQQPRHNQHYRPQ